MLPQISEGQPHITFLHQCFQAWNEGYVKFKANFSKNVSFHCFTCLLLITYGMLLFCSYPELQMNRSELNNILIWICTPSVCSLVEIMICIAWLRWFPQLTSRAGFIRALDMHFQFKRQGLVSFTPPFRMLSPPLSAIDNDQWCNMFF